MGGQKEEQNRDQNLVLSQFCWTASSNLQYCSMAQGPNFNIYYNNNSFHIYYIILI